MNKVLLGMVIATALACGSDAAELFGVPDAGAQPSDTFEYTCPESGWLLTDIDQRPLGEITIYIFGSARLEAQVPGGTVDVQSVAHFSIDGKVLANCEAGRPVTIEVRR